MLYVCQRTLASVPKVRNWRFRTKLDLAVRLVQWAAAYLCRVGKSVWVVADGAYAKRPFLRPLLQQGLVVVSRLRKDAHLRTVPGPPTGRRGRPRKYGARRIDLAKRAGQRRGWRQLTCTLYGQTVEKTYKTFLATYGPVGGLIRVVLVKEDQGCCAFFCTDANASVEQILEAFADRATIEQVFHDLKEAWGAGEQQLRNIWSNVAAFHLHLWIHTLVETWAWGRSHAELCDRSDSPWDDPERRPSHANRRKAMRQEFLRNELSALKRRWPVTPKIAALVQRLFDLAA